MRGVFFYTALLLLFSCGKGGADAPERDIFQKDPVVTQVNPGEIDEASGIADSKRNPGFLWVNEDGGNPNLLFLLSYTGEIKKRIRLKGMENRDWEDIALAKGPVANIDYVYLADIGNNNLSAQRFYIYRFPEPALAWDEVESFDKIAFTYPDGPHDAEAILVDNRTKDIFIITKRDSLSAIYRIAYPQQTSSLNKAELIGSFPFNGVVSAALSPEGNEVLVKTYSSIYYWRLNNGGSIEQVLSAEPLHVAYIPEPQGEAIAFKKDNSGFFTLSERPQFIQQVKLYFYSRR